MKTVIVLIGITLLAWYLFTGPEDVITTGQQSEISISAEEIQKILEVAAASQKVNVTTDTMYVTKTIRELLGIKIKIGEKAWEISENHRLKERRVWLLKAGSKGFELKKLDENQFLLEVDAPEILTKEHIAEDYQELEREGVWNPVTLKKLEISSRNRAVTEAIKAGLLREARLSLETSLLQILPTNVKIKINE